MKTFKYTAFTAAGDLRRGTMYAEYRKTIKRRLMQQGLTPITVKDISTSKRSLFTPKIKSKDIQIFTRQLAALLDTNIPVETAFGLVIETNRNEAMNPLLQRIRENIRQGSTIADALDSTVFDDFYISMIETGERSGHLGETVARLSTHLERQQEIRGTIQSALVYPFILLFMIIGTLVLMFTVILPKFQDIFEDMGDLLPLPTQFVLAVGSAFEHYGLYMALGCLFGLFATLRALRTPAIRVKIDGVLLRMPILGRLIISTDYARFARTLATLDRNSVPLPIAIDMAVKGLFNQAIKKQLSLVTREVRQGQSLKNALEPIKSAPPLLVQVVQLGEISGNLGTMLFNVASILERETKTQIDTLMDALVPLLTIGMGLIVGGLIGSIMLGIISINQVGF